MERIKQGLSRALWLILAVVFLIESWIWDHVRDGLRALAVGWGWSGLTPGYGLSSRGCRRP